MDTDTTQRPNVMLSYDTHRCSTERTYSWVRPRLVSEPIQMACDPVTFGPDRAPAPASVLWRRDGALIEAYRVPPEANRHCSLPSSLVISGPDRISSGEAATWCARLALKGPDVSVARRLVALTVDDKPVATAATGPDGKACATASPPEGSHEIGAQFAGDQAYLAATAAALVVVTPVVTPVLAPPPEPPVPPVPLPLPPLAAPAVPLLQGSPPQPVVVQVQPQPPAQLFQQSAGAEERAKEPQLAHQSAAAAAPEPDADPEPGIDTAYAASTLPQQRAPSPLVPAVAGAALAASLAMALSRRSAAESARVPSWQYRPANAPADRAAARRRRGRYGRGARSRSWMS
jgi:hypothetical protein